MKLPRTLRSPRLAATAAPLFLLAVLRLATPTSAPAAEFDLGSGASLNPAVLAEDIHPRALAAAEHAARLLALPVGPSPFMIPVSDQPAGAGEPAFGAVELEPAHTPSAMFALSSVMTSSSGAVIVLNGRLFGLHDSPAPGWTVTHIDPAARTATLTHESGRTQPLTLTRPMATPR